MNIKEFVSESLRQITDSIIQHGEYSNEKRCCPLDSSQNRFQKISFDIAVTVVEGEGSEGKAGISVWSIGAGVKAKSESSSSVVSRIKFDIPIEYGRY
jgi:hypothetical protein